MKRLFKNRIFRIILVLGIFGAGYVFWRLKFYVPNYKLETLSLDFSDENYAKLNGFREIALENGFLERSEDDYVPAEINYRSQFRKAQIRLKGDWTDHLGKNKWSFRIKLDEKMEDDLQIFSIQNLGTRGFLNAYVYHKLLKEEGVLTNEFRFLHLVLNGESWGVYCLEEHLTNRMIANQDKDEGVILKFTDDPFFEVAKEEGANTDGLIKEAEIKTYGGPKEDDQRVSDAKSIMLNYQFQKEGTFNDFDSSVMAKYYAVCDLATAYHAMGWINVRFYYNFKTKKMEPIGYDGYPELDWGKPYMGQNFESWNQDPYESIMIVYRALKNEAILGEYESALERITHPNYIQLFMDKHRGELEFLEGEIQKEYRNYEYDFEELKLRAAEIRTAFKK
jgi:hypothetical protein